MNVQRRRMGARALQAVFVGTLAASLGGGATAASAAEHGTPAQAKALADRAAAYIVAMGPGKAFPAFNDRHGAFIDRDLYVFVRTMDGNTVAHGGNVALIGHTSLALRDADGKLYNQQMIDIARTKGSGWVDYRWVNPVDRKIEAKTSFVERVGDYVVGVGFYHGS